MIWSCVHHPNEGFHFFFHFHVEIPVENYIRLLHRLICSFFPILCNAFYYLKWLSWRFSEWIKKCIQSLRKISRVSAVVLYHVRSKIRVNSRINYILQKHIKWNIWIILKRTICGRFNKTSERRTSIDFTVELNNIQIQRWTCICTAHFVHIWLQFNLELFP